MAETPENQCMELLNKVADINEMRKPAVTAIEALGPLFIVRSSMDLPPDKHSNRFFIIGAFCGRERAAAFVDALIRYIRDHPLPSNSGIRMYIERLNVEFPTANYAIANWFDNSIEKAYAVCMDVIKNHSEYLKNNSDAVN